MVNVPIQIFNKIKYCASEQIARSTQGNVCIKKIPIYMLLIFQSAPGWSRKNKRKFVLSIENPHFEILILLHIIYKYTSNMFPIYIWIMLKLLFKIGKLFLEHLLYS